jgi:hypothetical protein
MNSLGSYSLFDPDCNINVKERYMFNRTNELGRVKITWDENFEDINVIPLSYLFPPNKKGDNFYFSADYKWATTFVGTYPAGMDLLSKRVFFHLDNRYPNGISMAIYAKDYYGSSWGGGGSFVEHPVYGMCYAEEWHWREDDKERHYLRLYRMDDVLAEINRGLAGAE